jgi:hypothetical protein
LVRNLTQKRKKIMAHCTIFLIYVSLHGRMNVVAESGLFIVKTDTMRQNGASSLQSPRGFNKFSSLVIKSSLLCARFFSQLRHILVQQNIKENSLMQYADM